MNDFFGFALSILDTVSTRQKDNVENGKPRNAGLPWTTELRAEAAAKFKQGCSVDELAESDAELNIPFILGETVKVIDGPFNSFTGVIENINEEKKKLKVMVKIFGRKTPLELNYMQVEKEM